MAIVKSAENVNVLLCLKLQKWSFVIVNSERLTYTAGYNVTVPTTSIVLASELEMWVHTEEVSFYLRLRYVVLVYLNFQLRICRYDESEPTSAVLSYDLTGKWDKSIQISLV
jgi:hypothetical protein